MTELSAPICDADHSPSHTRFVVFSIARSGTSLLTSTLSAHDDIHCYGEIFHPNVEAQLSEDWRKMLDLDRRKTDPVGFAYSVLSFATRNRAVGFKMWHGQSPDACDALLADPAVKKIILERENKLAQFASWRLAKATDVWGLLAGAKTDQVRQVKTDFSRRHFLRFIRRNFLRFRYYRRHARGEVLDMTYAQLTHLGVNPVLQFLGFPTAELPIPTERLHSTDILSRFDDSCHEEIRSTLNELGKLEWLHEA